MEQFTGMENQELPVQRPLAAMLLKLFEEGASPRVQKGHGEMIFTGGQRWTVGKSPLRNMDFNRPAMVHRCQANSSVLGQPSNFE